MQVEVAYALKKKQTLLSFEVAENTNIQSAIEESGILEKYPEINLNINSVGIFGKITQLSDILREKDRIEIYRQLISDPKEVRKRKAAEGKAIGHKMKK